MIKNKKDIYLYFLNQKAKTSKINSINYFMKIVHFVVLISIFFLLFDVSKQKYVFDAWKYKYSIAHTTFVYCLEKE